MDDTKWGVEDKRGYWTPNDRIKYPAVFVWPPQLVGIAKWLPGYLFPWTVSYAALTALVWFFLTPSIEQLANSFRRLDRTDPAA